MNINEVLKNLSTLIKNGVYRTAREELRALSRYDLSDEARTLVAYNSGVFAWVHLGDGDEARNQFSLARALASKLPSSQVNAQLISNSIENCMILALSYDEYDELTAMLAKLSPQERILHDQVPKTQKYKLEGLPWRELMQRRAFEYANEDSNLNLGRYGCAASIFQLMCLNQDSLRLPREDYRSAVHTYATQLFNQFDSEMPEAGDDARISWEMNCIFERALPIVESYVYHNSTDAELLDKLNGVRQMLLDMAHYEAVASRFPGKLCSLKLIDSHCMGSNLKLVYKSKQLVSRREADSIENRLRALVNASIAVAAISAWIGCEDGPNDVTLLGIPIPGKYLEGRQQPTFVVSSSVNEQDGRFELTVGTRFIERGMQHGDPIAAALERSFQAHFPTVTV